jgi:hypothetical protein
VDKSLSEKELVMKRIIAAALLAATATSALALEIGAPYEQLQIDRQLPNVKDPLVKDTASGGATVFGLKAGLPYEQAQVDQQLPSVKDPVLVPRTQVAGPAVGIGVTEATGPWANDWNFIAPAP